MAGLVDDAGRFRSRPVGIAQGKQVVHLARISHTLRDEAQEFPGLARRAPRVTKGCMGTYRPRSGQAQRRRDGKNGYGKCGLGPKNTCPPIGARAFRTLGAGGRLVRRVVRAAGCRRAPSRRHAGAPERGGRRGKPSGPIPQATMRSGDGRDRCDGSRILAAWPAFSTPFATRHGTFLAWLKRTDSHPLVASSVFHYELEFIHPFADGNGRMGRLWQTLISQPLEPALRVPPRRVGDPRPPSRLLPRARSLRQSRQLHRIHRVPARRPPHSPPRGLGTAPTKSATKSATKSPCSACFWKQAPQRDRSA
jgi:hypothetical protein